MITKKIKQLELATGLTIEELVEEAVLGDGCEGICMNGDCDYTAQVEPDQDQGYCECCNTQSVRSVLVILGII